MFTTINCFSVKRETRIITVSDNGIASIHVGQLTDSCNQPQEKKGKPKRSLCNYYCNLIHERITKLYPLVLVATDLQTKSFQLIQNGFLTRMVVFLETNRSVFHRLGKLQNGCKVQ